MTIKIDDSFNDRNKLFKEEMRLNYKALMRWIALSMFISIAVSTNPHNDTHNAKYVDLLYSKIDLTSEINSNINNEYEKIGFILGYALGVSSVEKAVETLLSVDNYIIFSITKCKIDGEKRTIGYGLFGNVFFSNKEHKRIETNIRKYKQSIAND